MTSQVILVDAWNDQDRSSSSQVFTQDGERTGIGYAKRELVDGIKGGSDHQQRIARGEGF